MRLLVPVLVLLIIIGAGGAVSGYTPIGGATSVKTQGIIPLTPGPIFDNFDTASARNLWNDLTEVFSSRSGNPPAATASCTATFTDDPAIRYGASGYSLKLDYNVTQSGSYAGYYSMLGGGGLSAYKSVSFRVKGSAGGELFKVEFKVNLDPKNANKDHGAVYVTDYLDGGVTTDWKQVTIPLDNFANISDWSSAAEFVVTFENSQSSANGSPLAGIVYLDDIVFNTAKPPAIRIDYFDDKVAIDSLGGNLWAGGSDTGGTGEFSYLEDTGPNGTGKYSLQFHYGGLQNNTRWSAFSLPVGGGSDAWQKIQHDFSGYTAISFYVYGSEEKNGIQVELHDFKGQGLGEPFKRIPFGGEISDPSGPFGKVWKKYTIPFTGFKNYSAVALDPAKIAEVVFSVDYYNTGPATGYIFLDEIQFE